MSIKSNGRKLGRMIRRMTGLHLITCMHKGSKGHVSCRHSFNENRLIKEYDLHQGT